MGLVAGMHLDCPARRCSHSRSVTVVNEQDAWREQQAEAARERAAALARQQAGETARARTLIEDFMQRVDRDGPPPVPLKARGFDGRSYRTALTGWYVRGDRSCAVGVDGQFYVLRVPGGLAGRLRGVTVEASDAPMVLGAGGRDGDSVGLGDALERVLAGPGPG